MAPTALARMQLRSQAIDVLAQDYIKVARAKGLPERLVLTRHVLRNSLLPVITITLTSGGVFHCRV